LIKTEYPPIATIPPMFYVQPHGYDEAYTPEYFVDITDVFDKKSEVVNNNGYWASCCAMPGVEKVEVFSLCKNWPITAGAHKLLP
jgi:hypothetical protein